VSFKIPEYPDILTNANWQKNKGTIAKIAGGETGIGDLLKAAKAAFDEIEWQLFRITEAAEGSGKNRTMESIEAAYQKALKQGGKLKTLDTAVRDVERKAEQVAKEWAANKKIPSASAKHVKSLAEAAKTFNYATTLGTISSELDKEKQEAVDSLNTLLAEYRKLNDRLRKYVDNFPGEAEKATLASYPSLWKEHIRGVGTVLPTLIKDHPELKGEWEIWKQFSNSLNTPPDEPAFQKQMVILTKVAQALKPKLANI
jgi:hypothetical protein